MEKALGSTGNSDSELQLSHSDITKKKNKKKNPKTPQKYQKIQKIHPKNTKKYPLKGLEHLWDARVPPEILATSLWRWKKIPAPASAPAVGKERENPPGFWCFPSAAHPGTATPDCSAKLERLQEQRSGILGCFSPGKMVKVIKTEPSFGHSLKLENQIKIQNR